MNILHVIDKLTMDGVNPSSCAKLFVEWHKRHDHARFRLQVASLRARDAAGEFLENHGLEVFYIDKGKLSFANVGAIAGLVEKRGCDLLHLHGYSSANFGRIAARRSNTPAIVHEHAILKVLPHQYLADRLLTGKTDVAVAVSQAVAEFLAQGRSVPREKIHVIPNGIDLRAFQQPNLAKVRQFREQFAGPAQKLIGTVTRLREEKGNRFFIEAAREIVRHENNVRFVLVGEGPERGALERLAAELGLQEHVRFAGFVSDVASALSAFDIAVIPSLREGFGLALVEAMAVGRPIVASHVGGMVEMAQQEEQVLFVPPADADALAQAVLRILRDSELAGRLARAAHAQSGNFSIEKNVRELEALYSALAGNVKRQSLRPTRVESRVELEAV